MNRFYSATLCCILALILAACSAGNQQQSQPAPPDQRAADESTIRGLDADWVNWVSQRNNAPGPSTAKTVGRQGSLDELSQTTHGSDGVLPPLRSIQFPVVLSPAAVLC